MGPVSRLVLTGFTALLAILDPLAATAERGGSQNVFLYPVVRGFSWTESAPQGATLFRESGTLYGVGLQAESPPAPGIRFQGRIESWGGGVSYSGHTRTSGSPAGGAVATDAGYFALDMEGDIGWRLPGKEFAAIPFLGLGYRWWFRDIHEATAIDNAGFLSSTGPFFEPWSTLYAKMGLRGEYRSSGTVAIFVEAGGLYPFDAENSLFGFVSNQPNGRLSGFVEAGVTWGRFRITGFYEGLKFKGLDPDTTAEILGTPPLGFRTDSESTTRGIRIGVVF